jgi:hypothetical protein
MTNSSCLADDGKITLAAGQRKERRNEHQHAGDSTAAHAKTIDLFEDLVNALLAAVQDEREQRRYQRLLAHDLGDLSYMIEHYCQDPVLLQRCDTLVNRHAEACAWPWRTDTRAAVPPPASFCVSNVAKKTTPSIPENSR